MHMSTTDWYDFDSEFWVQGWDKDGLCISYDYVGG